MGLFAKCSVTSAVHDCVLRHLGTDYVCRTNALAQRTYRRDTREIRTLARALVQLRTEQKEHFIVHLRYHGPDCLRRSL